MNKKILAVSLLSVFAFSFVVAGVSAETRTEKKNRGVEKKIERRITNRMATSTNATSTSSFIPSNASSTLDVLTCVKNAVNARETGVISTQNVFNSGIQTALETRKSALVSAWSIENSKERKDAIKSAWKNFRTNLKEAEKILKESKKTDWTNFETARKNCKGSASAGGLFEENEGRGLDMSVSN